jgi:hypothetical protein
MNSSMREYSEAMKRKGRGRKPLRYSSGQAEENHGNNLFCERTLRDSKPIHVYDAYRGRWPERHR